MSGKEQPEEKMGDPHPTATHTPSESDGSQQAADQADAFATCPPVAPPRVNVIPTESPTAGTEDARAALASQVAGAASAADVYATQLPVPASQSGVSLAHTLAATAITTDSARSRFRVLQLHAKGGLGQVSVAHDEELHREVALKEIQNRFADDRDSRDRFLREARITGRLEHPGIVPVYGLGHYPDGRPYYAMRFIKGDSLKEAIESFQQAESPKRDPGQRSLDLHKLLGRFIDICNAIAYANSRGVLHRDLKPGNVMLGQFGETLVVDWGLAKTLTQPESAAGPTELSSRSADGNDETATQMGRAVGTPQFMSPEQAAGELDRMGPASDVYSLGATLYCLLTGRVPFEGRNVATILEQVQQGDFLPPRRVKPNVPRALDAICLKAMALQPENRYPTALALAADVENWMADEPVTAWREPWYIRTRRWIVRHRTLVTACGSAAAVALVSVIAVLLVIRAAREREQERLAALRTDAQKLVYAGEAAAKVQDWQNANLHLSSALAQIGAEPALADLKLAAEDLQTQTREQLAALAARQQAQEQHQQFTRKRDDALFHYGTLFTSMDLQANLHDTATAIHDALDPVGVSVDANAPVVLNEHFSKAERAEIIEGCYGLLLILAEVKVQSAAGQQPEKAKAVQQALRILDRAAQIGTPTQAYHLRRARYLDRQGNAEGAQQESERAQALQPVHAVDYFLLGDEWYKRGRLTEATVAFDHALRLQPDHFWAQFFLALRYLESQRPAEAKASLTACLSRRPEFPWLYLLRGMVHGGAGEFALAEADFQQALKLNPSPEARYVLWIYRGGMWNRQGKPESAVAELQQAIALMPDRPQAYESLIQAYLSANRLDEAAAQLELASRRWPKSASFHRLHARLALARDDPEAALRHFETAIQLQPPASTDLADDHLERGRILLANKSYAATVEACAAALQLRPDHTEACLTQVRALLELHKPAEAIKACDRYLEKGQPVAEIFRLRGRARSQQGDHAGAVDDFSRYLVAGADADLYVQRGWEYFECQAWSLALRDFQEALRLDAKNHFALNGRALAFVYLGQYREGLTDADAALAHSPDSPARNYNTACVYAMAASKAAVDAKEPERQALAGRYRLRAVELLQKSIDLRAEKDRQSFWRNTVQKDIALESIRKEPKYLRLAEQFEKPSS